jgi:hypothetical protein
MSSEEAFWKKNPISDEFCAVSPAQNARKRFQAGGFSDKSLLPVFMKEMGQLITAHQKILFGRRIDDPLAVIERVKKALLQVLRAGGTACGMQGHEWIIRIEKFNGTVEDVYEFSTAYASIL